MKALLTILLLIGGVAYGQLNHAILHPSGSGPLCYTVYGGHKIQIINDTIHSESVDTLYKNTGGDSLVWWNRYGRRAVALPASGGGSYTLPTATSSVLGGIKIGTNLSISSGVVSVTPVGLDGNMLYNNGGVITSSELAYSAGSASLTFTGISNLGTIRTNTPSGSSSTVVKFGSVSSNVWKIEANGTVYDIATATTPAFTALTDASTVTWSYNRYTSFNASVTIAGNRSLSLSGDADGNYGTIAVTQDGTGGRTFTLPGGDNTTNVTGVTTAAGSVTFYSWLKKGSVRYWNAKTY